MHRWWVKLWRRIEDSEIWDMPPLYAKVWFWLLIKVDRKDGSMTTTLDQMADRLQWVDNNQPNVPTRRRLRDILKWLEGHKMITRSLEGSGNRRYTRLTIVNWDTYQSESDGPGTETDLKTDHSTRSTKKVPGSSPPPSTHPEPGASAGGGNSKQDPWLNDLARLWELKWPNFRVPYSLFTKWHSQYDPAVVLAVLESVAMNDREVRNPQAYLTKALQRRRDETEQQQMKEDEVMGDHTFEMPEEKPK